MSKKLTKRSEDYSKWYNELVVKADLAENSETRGCMVIKPWGYALWENIQSILDSSSQILHVHVGKISACSFSKTTQMKPYICLKNIYKYVLQTCEDCSKEFFSEAN